jgi:hypothetical protein
MQNRIQIDEFVRQNLLDKEEQLNIGAWGNMERMLNGENPYSKQDTSINDDTKTNNRKKLFGLLLLLLTVTGTAFFAITKNKNKAITKIENDQNLKLENVNKNLSNTATANQATVEPAQVFQPNENNKTALATQAIQYNTIDNNTQQTVPINKQKNENNSNNRKAYKWQKANTISNNAEAIATETAITETANENVATNDKTDFVSVNEINVDQKQNITETKPKKAKKNKEVKKATTADLNSDFIAELEKPTVKNIDKIKKDSITKIQVSKKSKKVSRNKFVEIMDTVSVFKEEKVAPPQDIVFTNNASNIQSKEVVAPRVVLPVNQTNPRYMPNAKKLQKKQESVINAVTPKEKAEVSTVTASNSKDEKIEKAKNKSKLSPMEIALNAALIATLEQIKRVGYIKLFHQNIKVNPGVFTGINFAIFNNKQHDYGGYHLGGNLMIQIAKNLNLVPHLTFFARNNSGYSVTDNAIAISQKSVGNQYSPNWYAFAYQKDSTVFVHNFKRLYSLEAPIAVQYNRKNFAVYGGLNVAYNFKLSTSNVTKGYSTAVNDTVYSTTTPVYPFPTNRGTFYKSPDFNGRFGLGYIGGVNYHFTPNFYIDARVTQNVWDNSITNSSRELSKKMFRIPSYQITFGYRFKENSN